MNVDADRFYKESEARLLEKLRPQYVNSGYEFLIHPQRSDLPDFLASYVPDAIATKPDSKIAIEVLTRAQREQQPTIQRIRELFEGHPDWQLVVAYTGGEVFEQLSVSDPATILAKADEVRALSREGHLSAALLVAWSLLEASLNVVKPDSDKRPRTLGTVIQTLAMDGFISPEIEASLGPLVERRNRLAHGDLSIQPSQAEVELVLAAVDSALDDTEQLDLVD